MVVLVAGAGGQLGQSLRFIAANYPDIEFHFFNSSEFDITDKEKCQMLFSEIKPDYCINAAAYTAVDKAESEPEKARIINAEGARNLAEACQKHYTILLHISTDFVFDGQKTTPYTEADLPNPTGVYGQSKLDGENAVRKILSRHFIIRTSWVYSQFGSNFMKTMLRLASERKSLNVVDDQIGTPTLATDLADALLQIITFNTQHPADQNFGTYNYSNEGQCSWYDFAQKIFEINKIEIDLHPISTTDYPTPAKRPAYSVMDKSKIEDVFGIKIKNWKESLKTVQV
jgi:dTDP-4-dehydrorhamnose reductase